MAADLSVVIPAYNEEKSVRKSIENVKKSCPGAKIILVNDASTDDTESIARGAKVRVISHKNNKGYGAALKTGFRNAKTKYIAFLDADLTYDPRYIAVLLKELKREKLDIVWGNRFGGKRNKMPLIRKIGNRIIVFFLFLTTLKRIRDCTSGERVFRRGVMERLGLYELPDDLDFISALTKRIVKRGLKYKEIPINYEKRGGSSKLSIFSHGYRMLRNVLRY